MKTKNKRAIGIVLVAIIILIPLFAAFDVSGSKDAEAVSGGDEGDDIPILLKSRHFVPNPGIEAGLESRMSALAAEGLQRGHVVIQFNQLPSDSEREELKAISVDLQTYIPENAWFAAVETESLPKIQALPGVRWIGKIQAEDKIAPHIKDIGVGPWAGNPDGTVNLLVIVFDDVSAEEARAVIGKYGSVIEEPWLGNIWSVTIRESDITALASEDAVQWIEEVAPPKETHNDGLRAAIGGNAVQAAPYNLGGSGVVIAEWDAGHAESTHSDLSPRVTYGDTAAVHYHSTHVAGTAIGSGALSGGTLRGMAPQANLVSYEWPDSIPEMDSETRDAIVNHSAEISTNSWGYAIDNATRHNCYLHGYYDAESANYDDVVDLKLGYPITILFSAGNEENDGDCPPYPWDQVSGPGGTAKNTITVGATYSDTNGHACFSSRGPTDDGRIKPDVSAPGDQNGCLVRPMINSTWPGNTYDEIAGTSMSTPAVAGTAALLYQDYRNTHGGADPTSATVKALLIHTARDLGNVGPDYTFGWGLINATGAVDVIRADNHPVQTIFLNQVNTGTLRTIDVYVAPGTSQLRATLVWTDEPGAVNAAVELVNNVDLNVTHGASTYLPWRLDPANPANAATTGVDNRNNVEQVVINSPASGTYTINVRGTSIPTGPQPYTLIVTGRSPLPSNSITNIELTPPSPATLEFNEHIDITFDYSANEEGGVRIFMLPYTTGSPTSQYAVSGSPLYPVGTGSGSGYFTITSGEVTVDQVRFKMTNADQSEVLLEFFIPVKYHFGKPNIWVKPPSFELMLPPNTNWSGKLKIGNNGDGTLTYNIVDVETTGGPYFQWIVQAPDPLPAGESGLLKARVYDPNGLADIQYVKIWVTQRPSDSGALYDDGTGGDEIAGDGIYTCTIYGATMYGEEVGVMFEAKDRTIKGKVGTIGQTSSTVHISISPAAAAAEELLSLNAASGEGITGTAEPSGAYSSTVEGTSSDDITEAIEVTPAPSLEPASAVAWVALFEDTYPWGYKTIEDQLSANGIPYTTYKSSDMGNVDLTHYTKVITASVQSDEFWSALAENKDWFENYVSKGGVLEMHLAAYSGSNSPGKVYPGGFVYAPDLQNTVSIMYPNAPVVNMPNIITDPELDNWSYAAHGNFSTIPAGATVVLTATESGKPVFVGAKLGKGSIIATTQTVEWRAGHGYPAFLENMILFMWPSGPACPWLDENPKTGSVDLSGPVEITVTVNSNGLAAGKYSAEIHILNNDLDEYPTIVPLQLTVKTPGVEGKVLFDETHNPSGGYEGNATIEEAYADWAQLLRTWGWTVESRTSGPINYPLLQNYCVVVIPEPTVDYTDTEVAAIKQYVENGGGVLILGEWGSFAKLAGIFPVVNELAAPFGMSFKDDMVYDPLHNDASISYWPLIANFNRSVVGSDPDEVVEYAGCSIGTNGSALPVAWTYGTAYTTMAMDAAEAMVESSGAGTGFKAGEDPRGAPGGPLAPFGRAGEGQPTSSTGIDIAAESRVVMQDTEIQGSLAIAVIETGANITDSVQKALNELGYTHMFYQTDNFSLIPGGLSPYDVVIVGADGGAIDQEPDVAALYSFLNGGGRVLFLGGTAWESFVEGVDWYLLDVNTTNYGWKQVSGTPHLDIVDPTHPLASGLTDYNFTNLMATYYMLRITDPAIDIVAENGDGYPALITKGNLIWFINSPSQSYWTNNSDYNVLKTIIKNSLELKTIVMAASFYGNGRAMVIGDGNLFDNSDPDSDGTLSLYEYDNEKLALNIIDWLCNLPTATYFDTGAGTYPSISGTHNGTIMPNADITVSRLYTYPCEGTAGHAEYVKIWNESGPITEGHWVGYEGDWHTIIFNETVVFYASETYNYTIRTGSYPQIIHAPSYNAIGGVITCTEFVDVNGKRHEGWIPAIKLY
jgi:subtilisin family serine protease